MEIPYTNNTDSPKTIGLKRIDPGQTRMVEETLHPDYKPAGAAPSEPSDPVLELLDNSIKDIVPQLPGLTDEEFDAVWQGEQDGKTRSSLLKAFEEEKLRRAEITEATGASYDNFLEQLNVGDDELAAAVKAEQEGENREALVAAYEAEIARREAKEGE